MSAERFHMTNVMGLASRWKDTSDRVCRVSFVVNTRRVTPHDASSLRSARSSRRREKEEVGEDDGGDSSNRRGECRERRDWTGASAAFIHSAHVRVCVNNESSSD